MFSPFSEFSTSSLSNYRLAMRRRIASRPINTGRKTYKLTNKKREPVWPPVLESALIQGLAQYVPESSKDPRLLLRFPRRNKFISEFIKRKTGKFRTAKQVGSRLQQLRESCNDIYIKDLIESKVFGGRGSVDNVSPTNSSFSTSSYDVNWIPSEISSPASNAERLGPLSPCSDQQITVTLALYEFDSRPHSADAHPKLTLDLDETELGTSSASQNSSSPFTRIAEVRTTREIAQCSPVIIFTSNRFSLEAEYRCHSEVCIDGKIVYSSSAVLEPCTTGIDSPMLYRLEMRQDVWEILTRDPKNYPSYTMTQNIYTISTGTIHDEYPVFSIKYMLERGFNSPTYTSSCASPSPPLHYLYDSTQWSPAMQTIVQPDYSYTLECTPDSVLNYTTVTDSHDLGYNLPEVEPQLSLFYSHFTDLSLPSQEPSCSYQPYF